MINLFDTAISRTAPIGQSQEQTIGIYVCGSTVYGPPHIGHGRFALVYDILWRYLEYLGYQVSFVSNVTDLDDKIIDRAKSEGRSWKSVALQYEEQWWHDMELLNVRRPHHTPHATDYIDQMIELISKLEEAGYAYRLDDGVYMQVDKVPSYGLLAHQDLATLRSGARIAVDAAKNSPLDFALWKAAKPGEPSWDSPFGKGRPGWHTECVVMANSLLGKDFLLHGGGLDLCFPHHENERAQAAALGMDFAEHWMHNGLVEVGGQKMSKSLGNYTTLEDICQRHDPSAYRLLVLQSSYRSPLEVTPELMEDGEKALARIYSLDRRLSDIATSVDSVDSDLSLDRANIEEVKNDFQKYMNDDLNTPSATALLFVSLRQANNLLDANNLAEGYNLGKFVIDMFYMLGIKSYVAEVEISDELQILLRERNEARDNRDFVKADVLREKIKSLGYSIEDSASGAKLRAL